MELTDCHPSHKVVEHYSDWGDDRHQPTYRCTVCEEEACSMCRLEEGEPLAITCIGFPWIKATEIEGPDGIIRRVRKSGTGWPKPTRKTT